MAVSDSDDNCGVWWKPQCIGNSGSDDSYQCHGDDDDDVDSIDCNVLALYYIVIAPSKILSGQVGLVSENATNL